MMNALGLAEALRQTPTIESALHDWERRERPLTEHTQLWTRIYGATMFLPKPLKKISILVEKIPCVAAQYLRAAKSRADRDRGVRPSVDIMKDTGGLKNDGRGMTPAIGSASQCRAAQSSR
jgi:hypothetical protein